MNGHQRIEQFLARGLFEQVTRRTRRQRIINVVGILIYRKHDELRLRHGGFQALYRIDSTHARQIDVHQYNLWFLFHQRRQRGFRITPLAHQSKPRRPAHPIRNDLTCLGVVFNNGHGYRHGILITHFAGHGLS